jgi:phosphoglucosamine mutase
MGRLFGTDGVRGPAGEYPLDDIGTEAIGRAAGDHFAEQGGTAVIGWDPRGSSEQIVDKIADGLQATGVHVETAGVIPTPGLALATRDGGYDLGVMVTASHNGYKDNGIKIFQRGGNKLGDGVEDEVEERITHGVPDRTPHGSRVENGKLVGNYEDFLVATAGDVTFDGLRIVLDSANGASSGIAERVFTRLGAEVLAIGDNPQPRNINADGYGAGNSKIPRLREAVRDSGFEMGAAFDGDADRIAMVDENGQPFNGDQIMYALAKTRGEDLVVATVMSNKGTENAMNREGIRLDRRKVGDRYVLEGLAETGAGIGGEQSGHIIIPEYLATGDGMLAAIQMVRAVRESGKSLAEWAAEVPQMPQHLVNIPLPDRNMLKHPDVVAFEERAKAELGSSGDILLRSSGTEPLARVMVQSNGDAVAAAETYAADLQALLKRLTA